MSLEQEHFGRLCGARETGRRVDVLQAKAKREPTKRQRAREAAFAALLGERASGRQGDGLQDGSGPQEGEQDATEEWRLACSSCGHQRIVSRMKYEGHARTWA